MTVLQGQSPLHYAVIYGIKHTVTELIKDGSDSNVVDKNVSGIFSKTKFIET